MSRDIVHDTDHYTVYAVTGDDAEAGVELNHCHYEEYYEIVNKETAVAEMRHPVLPEALFMATHMNNAMNKKQWEWVGEADQPKITDPFGVAPNGEPLVPPADPETEN